MTNYLNEAFQKLSLLEDDFPLSENDAIQKLQEYMEDDIEMPEEEVIIDPEADTEDDLQDKYVGKIILECGSCHTRIYKDEEDVVIDEETAMANVGDECPVCGATTGWNVIGKIESYDADRDIEAEAEKIEKSEEEDDADDLDLLDNEGGTEEEEPEEESEEEEEEDFDEFGEALKTSLRNIGLNENEQSSLQASKELAVEDDEKLEDPNDDPVEEDPQVLEEALNEDDVCPECGNNPCTCKKHKKIKESKKLKEMKNSDKLRKRLKGLKEDNDLGGVLSSDVEDVDDDPDDYPDDYTGPGTGYFYKKNHPELANKKFSPEELDKMKKERAQRHKEVGITEGKKYSELKTKIKSATDEDTAADLLDPVDDALEKGEITKAQYKKLYRMVNPEETFDESLTEGIENLSLDTESTHMEMSSGDDGSVNISTSPRDGGDDMSMDDLGGDMGGGEPSEDEMIAPLDSEEQSEIENNEPEGDFEDMDFGGEEEAIEGEEEGEEDIEDFDEESFEDMGESYMRKVYENVKSFKMSNVTENNDQLIVEGIITFDSGKKKPTTFIFENAKQTKRGKIVLEGYNKTFSNAKKAFILKGSVNNKKYISESMIYSYKTRQLNESNDSEVIKVHGRVKRK